MWMFHSKNTSNKIYELHESALRLVSDNYMPTFEELLEKGKSFTFSAMLLQEIMLITICTHNQILLFHK